jgi:hypothetical protein
MSTKNYGLLGGTLDAEKHIKLAADPAAYMRKLAMNPWASYTNARRDQQHVHQYFDGRQN